MRVRLLHRSVAVVAAAALGVTGLALPASGDPDDFVLQLLHASDLEGGVDAITRAPNFAALADALEESSGVSGTLIVSAGDNYIPGPFFSAAGDSSVRPVFNAVYNETYGSPGYNNLREGGGRLDISIMNVIGFDASAIGNHEFDLGSDVFASVIGADIRGSAISDVRWPGAQFPYLSTNLDFSGDGSLGGLFTDDLELSTSFGSAPGTIATPQIAPNTLVEVGSEMIGVVGATTPIVQSISSPTGTTVVGPTTDDMPALATVLQPAIDEVVDAGANKVVLLTHLQQISLEEQLIGLLNGVDIVVAGGSDTLLADSNDVLRPGDLADREYPLETTNAEGDPALIVSTDGEYSYLGRLVVGFDANGVLQPSTLDQDVNGPIPSLPDQVTAVWTGLGDPFADGTKGDRVQALVDAVTGVVTAKDSFFIGETDVFVEGRREKVRTEETNLGNLSADANLALAQAYDPSVVISLKNGGGIRAEIGEIVNNGTTTEFLPPQDNPLVDGDDSGLVSQLDLENSLRFNNNLTLVTVTAEELLALIEHGVAESGPGETPGRFPQISGVRFSFDVTRPANDRVVSMALVDAAGSTTQVLVVDGDLVVSPSSEYRLVTLGFLAGGGDGYPFPNSSAFGAPIADPARVDLVNLDTVLTDPGTLSFALPGTEQDALAEFLGDNFPVGGPSFADGEVPPESDMRIQQIGLRSDDVLEGVAGTSGDDRFVGTRGADVFFGGGGDDRLLGQQGDDMLAGGPGNDLIIGGSGRDTIVVVDETGRDHVLGFDPQRDRLDLSAVFNSMDEVEAATTSGFGRTVISLPSGGQVTLPGLTQRRFAQVEILL